MIEAARQGRFEIIMAEVCTRLWRNLAEQAPRLAELADLGVEVVTQDLDTRQESAGILAAVLGAGGEAYRREVGRRTRRGLEGRAREQKPTGGKSYGYEQGEIVPEAATIVREIFESRSAEDLILEPVRTKLLQPEFIAYRRRYARRLAVTPAQKPDRRLEELKRLVSNGVLSAKEAEPAMRRLSQPGPKRAPEAFGAADAYVTALEALRTALDSTDVSAARPPPA